MGDIAQHGASAWMWPEACAVVARAERLHCQFFDVGEGAARAIAEHAFAVKAGYLPGQGIWVPPWASPQHVRVERIDDARWRGDGDDGVLAPSLAQGLRSAGRRA